MLEQLNNFQRRLAACALIVTVAVLSACSKPPPAVDVTPASAPTASAADLASQQQAAAFANLSAPELKRRGDLSLREQRLYAPAGDNALEYFIALRAKSATPNGSAVSALNDLLPYAVIAAEQAINRGDFVEAERLRKLIELADPQAPSLPRIAEKISKGQLAVQQRDIDAAARLAQDKAAEQAKLRAEQQAAAQAAQEQAASATSAPATATTQPVAAKPEPTPITTTNTPSSTNTATAVVAAQPPAPKPLAPKPEPAVAQRTALLPVSTPQPDYPVEAARAGLSGQVQVSFTVNPDGSVSNIVVVQARPRATFERNVVATVRRWKFQPIDEAQKVTRTFNFSR